MGKTAYLVLENGKVFQGRRFGASGEVMAEIVFTTGMTGYLETLTDQSYFGQTVVQTFPLIGNYGVIPADFESDGIGPRGYIAKHWCQAPSNFRSEGSLDTFFQERGVTALSGIDTRALTKILREKGTMNGMITTVEYLGEALDELLPRLHAYTTGKVVEKVTCATPYTLSASRTLADNGALSGSARFDREAYAKGEREKRPSLVRELNGKGLKVALMDFGAKDNIARSLAARGCEVTVYPALTSAEEILGSGVDGVMLSNGPGDPKECVSIIEELKKLYASDMPVFAICLGHQLMALATGADTYKMKYGHRGGNHPVKDLATGRVYISSQNHGYVVDTEHLDPAVAVPAFVNVNDGTNEGLSYTGKNIFTVQFHPEACCGPQDSGYLFDRFIGMMQRRNET